MDGEVVAVTQRAITVVLERREGENRLRINDWEGRIEEKVHSLVVGAIDELLVGE